MTTAFSRRTGWDLEESAYARAVREAGASSGPLFDLTISNPTACGLVYSDELLGALANSQALVYDPDPRGIGVARRAVAAYYADHGAVVSAESLILTTSTSESYSFLFRLLCDPGDEVLVAQPSYPLFDFLATLDDVLLRQYPLFFDHGWWIDFAELERGVNERTRAIVVVHPNNPTGHWTFAAERTRLEELCAQRGLALIVDEVFLDYPLDPAEAGPRSFARGPHPVLTFCLSGLSKIAGLPQMKAAWLAVLGPEVLRREALGRLEAIADTFLSMNAPVQLALPVWLRQRAGIQGQILGRIRENLAVLNAAAAAHPDRLRVLAPQAGWTAVIALPCCAGELDCAERLVREFGVVVHPGEFYGMGEWNRVVISLLPLSEVFREGLRRMIEV